MAKKNEPPKSEVPARVEMTDAEFDKAFKEGALEVGNKPFDFAETFTQANIEGFFRGEVTWGQLMGMTVEEAYAIAEYGYQLYEEGKFHEARKIFEGLVMANPYDAYFHNILGAVFQQLDEKDLALDQYNIAIDLDPEAVHPYINRGEMLMQNGQFTAALSDLKKAVELDKDNDPTAARARTMVNALTYLTDVLKIR